MNDWNFHWKIIELHAQLSTANSYFYSEGIIQISMEQIWLVVWNIWIICPYIGNVLIPTSELRFFRGVGSTTNPWIMYRWWIIYRSCEETPYEMYRRLIHQSMTNPKQNPHGFSIGEATENEFFCNPRHGYIGRILFSSLLPTKNQETCWIQTKFASIHSIYRAVYIYISLYIYL